MTFFSIFIEITLHHKTSHSGLLVQRASRAEVGKYIGDAPMSLTTSGSSRLSSFAIPKRSFTRGIHKPESYDDKAYDFTRKHDYNIRDRLHFGSGLKGHNNRYSGPLLPPASNTNQMPRDHENRHFQEISRHAHGDRGKQKRIEYEPIPLPTNALYIGSSSTRPKQ
ncbi:hypothetical protein AgCh_037809 [Apium graveolens]